MGKTFLSALLIVVGTVVLPLSAFSTIPPATLKEVPQDELRRSLDGQLWADKETLLNAIEHSLSYLKTPEADRAYAALVKTGVTRARVERTLRRFRSLLRISKSADELNERLLREFRLYRAVNAPGSVRFTGYFQPTYEASPVRTPVYRYPIFRPPSDFSSWRKPHPTRIELEGWDGTGDHGRLKGREIAWLKSRYEAYMIHVQGSAVLRFPDGEQKAVGFAGGTDYRFSGVGANMLKKKGFFPHSPETYFAQHPAELSEYLALNNRFIFFKENRDHEPVGCLGVPVIAERSIATDKSQLPPGALALIQVALPKTEGARIKLGKTSRLVLDHDTGSAIRGPQRVDIFMGSGPEAQKRANAVSSKGDLYYLLLK